MRSPDSRGLIRQFNPIYSYQATVTAQLTVRVYTSLDLLEQHVLISSAIHYARLAVGGSGDGLGLPDSRKAVNTVVVFAHTSSLTGLILFEQICHILA